MKFKVGDKIGSRKWDMTPDIIGRKQKYIGTIISISGDKFHVDFLETVSNQLFKGFRYNMHGDYEWYLINESRTHLPDYL